MLSRMVEYMKKTHSTGSLFAVRALPGFLFAFVLSMFLGMTYPESAIAHEVAPFSTEIDTFERIKNTPAFTEPPSILVREGYRGCYEDPDRSSSDKCGGGFWYLDALRGSISGYQVAVVKQDGGGTSHVGIIAVFSASPSSPVRLLDTINGFRGAEIQNGQLVVTKAGTFPSPPIGCGAFSQQTTYALSTEPWRVVYKKRAEEFSNYGDIPAAPLSPLHLLPVDQPPAAEFTYEAELASQANAFADDKEDDPILADSDAKQSAFDKREYHLLRMLKPSLKPYLLANEEFTRGSVLAGDWAFAEIVNVRNRDLVKKVMLAHYVGTSWSLVHQDEYTWPKGVGDLINVHVPESLANELLSVQRSAIQCIRYP